MTEIQSTVWPRHHITYRVDGFRCSRSSSAMSPSPDGSDSASVDLYFGPVAPTGHEGEWIKTIPGKGWFVYFRVYDPAFL
jgi:hypothetical protein